MTFRLAFLLMLLINISIIACVYGASLCIFYNDFTNEAMVLALGSATGLGLALGIWKGLSNEDNRL